MTSAIVQATNWNSSQLAVIKNQIAKGCTDDELVLFSEVCKKTGLDPFSRQIYAVPMGGKMTIQVGIDGLRLIADRSGQYTGSQTFWCGEDGVWKEVWLKKEPPMAAKTVVYKNGGNGFVGVALWSEYNQGKGLWSKMPIHMIGKVSEAAALRRAFPAELSGLYATEEMPEPSIDAEVIDDRVEKKRLTAEMMRAAADAGVDKEGVKALALQQFGKSSSSELEIEELMWMVAELRKMAEKVPAVV